MNDRRKAKAPGGGPGARRAGEHVQSAPIVPQVDPLVNTPHLVDLLTQAAEKARRAGLAWRTAKEMSRPLREVCFYRRLMLSHQSVWWTVRQVLLERRRTG